ncbi:MAG TPA: Lrp/AsnC family transcriptional regulator, partial [Methanolinea sp.]|nr:Lrp/AsnC family transcriptional regulator [Methanolinea sp.]
MDRIDRDLLAVLEQGLPVTGTPFEEIGRRLGITESDVLDRLHQLKSEGVIRRFKARIDQRKV